MFESLRHTRSTDYPFGLVELVMPMDGKGEGRLWAAVSLEFTAEKRLEVKNYGTQPFRVMQIRRKASKIKG